MFSSTPNSPANQLLGPIARMLLVTQFVALVLVAAGTALLVVNARKYQAAGKSVQHTLEVLDEIETVRTELLRGNLALRNYAISPSGAYLASTRRAARNAADAVQRLQALVQDNVTQAPRAFELRAEVSEVVGWMNGSAVIADRDGQADLLVALRPHVEKDSTRLLRELLAEIEAEERLLLQSQSDERVAGYRRLVRGASLVAGAFFAFLMWSVIYASLLLRRSKASIQDLKESADLDPLTGLLNRRALGERFDQCSNSPLTVVALDFDNFKSVNDAYGHAAGDEVLRVGADRLRRECRDSDLIARIGGDEFAVVLTGISDVEMARGFCRRIEQAMREPIPLSTARVQIGASIGFQISPGGVMLKDLLASADAVSYDEKSVRKTTPHTRA